MTKISNQYSLTNVLFADAVNGRVGIGTASPLYPLESAKDITYSDNIVNGDAQFSVAGLTTRTKRMTFGYDTNSANGFGYIKTGNQGVAYTPLYLNPAAAGAGGVAIGYAPSVATPPSSGLLVQGNVGIGTSSPFVGGNPAKLQVKPATDINLAIQIGTADSSGVKLNAFNDAASANIPMELNGSIMILKTAETERMRITSGGTVLIGTTSSTSAQIGVGSLQVNKEIMSVGSLSGLFWENRSSPATATTNWYGWYTSGGTIFLYNGSGNIANINSSSGAYTATSDVNKKKDFEQSNIGLNEVLQLKPTLYRMKTDDESSTKELGFIAQEVKEFIPQAYNESGEGEDKFIGLNQMPIIAALTKAIQEQQLQINELKALLNA